MSGSYLFIEAIDFTRSVKRYFGSDESYAEFQLELALQPDQGSVITGAAPLRKLRWSDARRGMGKRGGLRVIYIHIPEIMVLFMLDVYGKDEADDLTGAEKKELQSFAHELVEELKARSKRRRL